MNSLTWNNATSQYALDLPSLHKEVEALMGFLYDCINILGQGLIFRNLYAQELEVVDSLHHCPINEDRFVDPRLPRFLGLTDFEQGCLALFK